MNRVLNFHSGVATHKNGYPLGYIGSRSAEPCDGMDERGVTPQVMGRTLAVMAWMAAVRFEPIRGPEQISRPIDCFPLCPKILFMQPSGSSPQCSIFPARQRGALWNNNNKEN